MDKIDSLLNDARSLFNSGDFDKAKLIYLSLIESNNILPEALTNLGNIALQAGNIEEGIEWLEKSIILEKNQPQALSNLGIALMELKRPLEAIVQFISAIKIDPYSKNYHFNIAIAYEASQNYGLAINSYQESIRLDVKFIDAHINLGNVYSKLHNFEESIKEYQIAIHLNPYHVGAYLNIGTAYRNANKLKKAIDCFQRAIDLDQNNFEAYLDLGITYEMNYRFLEAIPNYLRAREIKPDSIEPYINLASSYTHLNKLDLAINCCEQAIQLDKDNSGAYVNLGNIYNKKKQYDNAINKYDIALNINPKSEEAYLNKSLAYLFLGQHQKAEEMNKKAIEINPQSYGGLTNSALIYQVSDNFDKAIMSCQAAINLKPELVPAYIILADTYNRQNNHQEAANNFEKVLEMKEDIPEALAGLGHINIINHDFKKAIDFFYKASNADQDYYVAYLHCKSIICNWTNFEIKKIIEIAKTSRIQIIPFMFLNLADQPLLQKRLAVEYIKNLFAFKNVEQQIRPFHSKIRIGYFSADFHNEHPVAHLTRELFTRHDRSKFEIYFFSFIKEHDDLFQKTIKKNCEAFIDVSSITDEKVVLLANEKEIDIAIDLTGYTRGSRTAIFSKRVAPIQINYLGYPGTMGAPFMDYIIADKFIIPTDKQDFYSEKVIYLPGCFQPNNSKIQPSKNTYTRKDESLPQAGFVFCSFNSTPKIMPSIFDIWMRILDKVKGSVLWLASCSEEAKNNLWHEAVKRGIEQSRLIFADRKDLFEDHLERLKLADLFLDSFPYNAHTTASDALRSAVPLLTIAGETFASRVAGSLLKSLDLEELIVSNEKEYETKAIQLATHSEKYAQIKELLKYKLMDADLFNTELYTKNLENAYCEIYQRHLNKVPLDHVRV
jgi:predicted O-linked N-acetylglucosamine transferase (SPINDLY family)